ncbi:PAS/PAC sensor signal transduction histidine kinase [Alicyclobacillus hesperidum URH17-3-68]|nr:PAS/PAC sensor signal transduction histidine kinase [Alicyclobacillus hesperidum URH17-3-68]
MGIDHRLLVPNDVGGVDQMFAPAAAMFDQNSAAASPGLQLWG